MFKNLKDKITTEVSKTGQSVFSSILSNDSPFLPKNFGIQNDNQENNRSRLDSSASDISQTTNYSSPTRQFLPPSDIESEYGGNESDLIEKYKAKYIQLKKAYGEIEDERDRIKDFLQKSQDTFLKQKADLREQSKIYQNEISFRDKRIEELTKHQEENQNLLGTITKLKKQLVQCKEEAKSDQEKRANLIIEHENLLQQLNEKQTVIKGHQSTDSTRLHIQQLEIDLQSAEEQQKLYEEIFHQNKQQIEDLQQNLSIQNEQHSKLYDALKTEHENLINELQQTKQAKDNIQSLLDQTIQQKTDNQPNVVLTELQPDYTQTLENQSQEIATLKIQQQTELDKILKEHEQTIEKLKTDFENIRKEQLTSQITDEQKEINRIQQLLNEQINKSNQYEEELKEKSSLIIKLEQLQDQLDQKTSYIQNIEKQFEEHQQFRQTIETSQNNNQQLLEEKEQMIEKLHQQLTHESKLHEEQNEKYSQLEIQFNKILSEKSDLENQLDNLRVQIRQFEQTIKEYEINQHSNRTEIDKLKSEIISFNEENTRRIDEYKNEKFNFEQEINEKNRQIIERDEKLQESQSNLEQTKESNDKLRKALQKLKESSEINSQNNNEDKTSLEIHLKQLTEDYEQRLKEQDIEYNEKLKGMAKEMSLQIDQKEQIYKQQLHDLIQNNHKIENELVNNSEQRIANAEQRALIAEEQMSKMDEQLKEKQLDHYRIVQDLQNQIQTLTKEETLTTEHFAQTTIEDLDHSHLVESTEFDYLKRIVLAYMTEGTDPMTMVKVICAVLRYTDDETSLIVDHEKIRQSRWLNSSK